MSNCDFIKLTYHLTQLILRFSLVIVERQGEHRLLIKQNDAPGTDPFTQDFSPPLNSDDATATFSIRDKSIA